MDDLEDMDSEKMVKRITPNLIRPRTRPVCKMIIGNTVQVKTTGLLEIWMETIDVPGTLTNWFIEVIYMTDASSGLFGFEAARWGVAIRSPSTSYSAPAGIEQFKPERGVIATGKLAVTKSSRGQQIDSVRVHAHASRKVRPGDDIVLLWKSDGGLSNSGSAEKYVTVAVTCWLLT